MKTFISYLKTNIRSIGIFCIFFVVFFFVLGLYGIPRAPVIYCFALGAFLGAIILSIDYVKYYKKIKGIEAMIQKIDVELDQFPPPRGAVEEKYQQLVETLYADKTKKVDTMENQYSDLVEYYSTWAHQIKTPIAAMHLILQSKEMQYNRPLQEQLQRIEQYVEMVMVYLRLESESSDYVIRSYNLDSIVKQAIRSYASQFIFKKLKLNYEVVEKKVMTDEKWLLFVIEQILSNSLKYTNSGEIRIRLEEPSTLVIEDTGMGIASEDLPRVFEKGYTGYNGRNNNKASGIGLYICKRILDRLGHSIRIESQVEIGTKVMINLATTERDFE